MCHPFEASAAKLRQQVKVKYVEARKMIQHTAFAAARHFEQLRFVADTCGGLSASAVKLIQVIAQAGEEPWLCGAGRTSSASCWAPSPSRCSEDVPWRTPRATTDALPTAWRRVEGSWVEEMWTAVANGPWLSCVVVAQPTLIKPQYLHAMSKERTLERAGERGKAAEQEGWGGTVRKSGRGMCANRDQGALCSDQRYSAAYHDP